MKDDFQHQITKQEADAAHAIAEVALAKARELRVNPFVMQLAVVTLHEHAREVAGASTERADDLFKHLAEMLRDPYAMAPH